MDNGLKKIKNALISVYYKDKLDEIVKLLDSLGVNIYSTGGTFEFIETLDITPTSVEMLTSYPSIFGGRVKTLHPKVFGGILARRDNIQDKWQLEQYGIPPIDLVIVDLYPFEETLKLGGSAEEIIEKIDIGGVALIRAGAKNFNDVLTISCRDQYGDLISLLKQNGAESSLDNRKVFACKAFQITSKYDTLISNYFLEQTGEQTGRNAQSTPLRYGENPHQKAMFEGDLSKMMHQLHGKELSYNNLLDIDAAVALINDIKEPAFAILKHNNACGCAVNNNLAEAWKEALAADPVSAYGGIVVTNREVTKECAEEINKLFFEVILAPSFEKEALELLESKKNRIILEVSSFTRPKLQVRSVLNGQLVQEVDNSVQAATDLKTVTKTEPKPTEINDLLFANVLVKHSKSNTIVLVKNNQLIASGVGQTSRVDALKQAIEKARSFGFSLDGAVMASDAFFPFPDCVEIAHKAGITAVIQPGGSVRDQESIDYCDKNGIAMVFTGVRHFKH